MGGGGDDRGNKIAEIKAKFRRITNRGAAHIGRLKNKLGEKIIDQSDKPGKIYKPTNFCEMHHFHGRERHLILTLILLADQKMVVFTK